VKNDQLLEEKAKHTITEKVRLFNPPLQKLKHSTVTSKAAWEKR